MKKFQILVDLVEAAKNDFAAFEKGNKAAGTRLRKKMQEAKTLASEIRKEVSTVKNTVN